MILENVFEGKFKSKFHRQDFVECMSDSHLFTYLKFVFRNKNLNKKIKVCIYLKMKNYERNKINYVVIFFKATFFFNAKIFANQTNEKLFFLKQLCLFVKHT